MTDAPEMNVTGVNGCYLVRRYESKRERWVSDNVSLLTAVSRVTVAG